MRITRLVVLTALAACAPRTDLSADRAELLRLHEQARTAHLGKQPDLMVASFADTLLDISGGLVSPRTRAQRRSAAPPLKWLAGTPILPDRRAIRPAWRAIRRASPRR